MSKQSIVVKVGIAGWEVVRAPDTIKTSGLGSCVGIVIYDPYHHIAGLAHIMLPDSSLARQENINPGKYANSAVDLLIRKLIEFGAIKRSLKAKLAGGAQMFQFDSGTDLMRIGPRNVTASEEILKYYGIPIIAKDVGGKCGRTIEFSAETCKLKVRTVTKGEIYI